ncbi:MAG: hypothetical protein HQ501_04465 [Rhodospirillales bacterium]|nr:hypothetical protein [Rhodospirillales bacterium]
MKNETVEKAIALVAFLLLWAIGPLEVGIPHWYFLIVAAFWALLSDNRKS